MKRSVFIVTVAVFVILGAVLSYQLMTWFLSDEEESKDMDIKTYEDEVTIPEGLDATKEEEPTSGIGDIISADTKLKSRITPSTRIVYQYYYTVDDKMVTDETEPPYYLLDMTRQELEMYYQDWQLMSFSADKVVLRKNIDERHVKGYYIVQAYEDYIAVFYDYTADFQQAFDESIATGDSTNEDRDAFLQEFLKDNEEKYLREILDMPIELLSPYEVDKLQEGIVVYGDEELISILESYTS